MIAKMKTTSRDHRKTFDDFHFDDEVHNRLIQIFFDSLFNFQKNRSYAKIKKTSVNIFRFVCTDFFQSVIFFVSSNTSAFASLLPYTIGFFFVLFDHKVTFEEKLTRDVFVLKYHEKKVQSVSSLQT
jgi:hypothetical protein